MIIYDLCKREDILKLLEDHSLSPKKSFGQNFLVNRGIIEMICDGSFSFVKKEGPLHGVIEIGPGVGALTESLLDTYDRVVSVEIDRGLSELLKEMFGDRDSFHLIENDFMKISLTDLLDDYFGDILDAGGDVSICANIPYYITSDIVMHILESFPYDSDIPFSSVVIMIQKEVADRYCASPGKSEYGSITASINLRADVMKIGRVSSGCFYPAPKVDSSVIAILPNGGISRFDFVNKGISDIESFGKSVNSVISLAFGQRRKTLLNALSSVYSKDNIAAAIEKCGFRPDIRGEKLSAEDFCRLTSELEKLKYGL